MISYFNHFPISTSVNFPSAVAQRNQHDPYQIEWNRFHKTHVIFFPAKPIGLCVTQIGKSRKVHLSRNFTYFHDGSPHESSVDALPPLGRTLLNICVFSEMQFLRPPHKHFPSLAQWHIYPTNLIFEY